VPQVFSKVQGISAARSILQFFCRTINFTVFLPQDFAASAAFGLCLPQEISR
jgi:hypothetical protein